MKNFVRQICAIRHHSVNAAGDESLHICRVVDGPDVHFGVVCMCRVEKRRSQHLHGAQLLGNLKRIDVCEGTRRGDAHGGQGSD